MPDSLPARLVQLGKAAQIALETQDETAWNSSKPALALFAHDLLVGEGFTVMRTGGLCEHNIAQEFVDILTQSERDRLEEILGVVRTQETVIVQTLRDTLAHIPNIRSTKNANFVETVLGATVPSNAGGPGQFSLEAFGVLLNVKTAWTAMGSTANARYVTRTVQHINRGPIFG